MIVFGFIIGIVAINAGVALVGFLNYGNVASNPSQFLPLMFSKKYKITLCLLSILILAISFIKFRQMVINELGDAPLCIEVLKSQHELRYAIGKIAESSPPSSMDQFLDALQKNLGVRKSEVEKMFTCPRSLNEEISFQYFPPDDLKPGIDRFILLYERPNNDLPGTERTIIYNNGEIGWLPEQVVLSLLKKQSISQKGFIWQTPKVDILRAKSWWERERDKKATRKAILPSIIVLAILEIAVFLSSDFRQTKCVQDLEQHFNR